VVGSKRTETSVCNLEFSKQSKDQQNLNLRKSDNAGRGRVADDEEGGGEGDAQKEQEEIDEESHRNSVAQQHKLGQFGNLEVQPQEVHGHENSGDGDAEHRASKGRNEQGGDEREIRRRSRLESEERDAGNRKTGHNLQENKQGKQNNSKGRTKGTWLRKGYDRGGMVKPCCSVLASS
jgi:hypothetical protein